MLKKIPVSLLDGGIVVTPGVLQDIYREKLVRDDLVDVAMEGTKGKSPIGGEEEEETNRYFAERYQNSSTRIQYLVVNPHGCFNEIQDWLLMNEFIIRTER